MTKVLDPIDATAEAVQACLDRVHRESGGGRLVSRPDAFLRTRVDAIAACTAALAYAQLRSPFGLPEVQTPDDIADTLRSVLGEDSPLAARPSELGLDGPALIASSAALREHRVQDLGRTYEVLLGLEFHISGEGVSAATGKSSRNQLGAYYTPPALADAVVAEAVSQLFRQRFGTDEVGFPSSVSALELELLESLTVADRACGAGAFLRSYLRLLRGAIDDPGVMRTLALTLRGSDVDAVALEVARIGIALDLGDTDLIGDLAPCFLQENPLLRPPNTLGFPRAGSVDQQREAGRSAFREGHVYHRALASRTPDLRPDLEIGNPPWEKVRIEERAFFSRLAPHIAALTTKGARAKAIESLRGECPSLHAYYEEAVAQMEWARDVIRQDPRLSLGARGELNTYALFAALADSETASDGVVALLVKSGLFTTASYREFFASLVDRDRLVAVYDFVNRDRLFAIDSRERFAFFLGGKSDGGVRFMTGLTSPDEIEPESLLRVTQNELEELNPVTGMLPSIRSSREVRFLLDLAEENEPLGAVYPEAEYGRLVHLTLHAAHVHRLSAPSRIPVNEGKLFEQYDGRFATFEGVPTRARYTGKASARPLLSEEKRAGVVPEARYFVEQPFWDRLSSRFGELWSIIWRNTTSASNRRTCVATILPHGPGTQSVQLLQLPGQSATVLAVLLAVLNSLPFDFSVRRKLNGIDLTQTVLRQVSVPPRSVWGEIVEFGGQEAPRGDLVAERVRALLADDVRLESFCADLPSLSSTLSPSHRQLQRDVDLLVADAYGITPETLAWIAEDFAADLTLEETDRLSDPSEWPSVPVVATP